MTSAIRGPALTFVGDPFAAGVEAAWRHEPDALIVIEDGRVRAFGPAAGLEASLPPGTATTRYGADTLILPGFVDAHVHYPQTGIVGAGGLPLLDWLERHTFPAELRFADPDHARATARLYLRECLRAGTTSAAVFGTVHPVSVDVFFEEAARFGMRTIAGKVMMDRNAPADLLDTARRGYDESKALIGRWHGRGRAGVAVTPRFAATSTPEQLEAAAALWHEHPGTWLQSHLAENRDEVRWVRQLHPQARSYLDVYDRLGLLGERAIYAHCLWLDEADLQRLHDTGTAVAFCPSSNLFLGSGLFDLRRAMLASRPLRVALATDVGAGTSLSLLSTMADAYKVARLQGQVLGAAHAYYLATRGAAAALRLDDLIGSIAPGLEADLVVLDLHSNPLLEHRLRHCGDLQDALFARLVLGDERAVRATWVAGRPVYDRDRDRPWLEDDQLCSGSTPSATRNRDTML